VTAALAFQSITVARVRPTVALLIGIERMPQRLRLQFLGRAADPAAIVLGEKQIRSADISAAGQEIADIVWPTHSIGWRLIDVDGRVIHEESRADIGGYAFRPS
jgi:hypothetical protein